MSDEHYSGLIQQNDRIETISFMPHLGSCSYLGGRRFDRLLWKEERS